MRVIVSIPDELARKAEALAARRGLSLDELYTLALEEYAKEQNRVQHSQ